MRLHTHFPSFEKGRATPGLILCLCGAFPAPLLWGDPACYRRSPRTELLLIYRIQSHTHPKRRKFCLKHAGQKSVKEELPEQRKGPKRAVECRLKAQTHVWDHQAGSSSLPSRTKSPLEQAPEGICLVYCGAISALIAGPFHFGSHCNISARYSALSPPPWRWRSCL